MRVHNDSATLIDNIFDYLSSENVVSDITDHFSQFLVLHLFVQLVQPPKIILRDYSKFSKEIFLQE